MTLCRLESRTFSAATWRSGAPPHSCSAGQTLAAARCAAEPAAVPPPGNYVRHACQHREDQVRPARVPCRRRGADTARFIRPSAETHQCAGDRSHEARKLHERCALRAAGVPVPLGDVSAGQRHCVVRDRIELSTFRFSGQPRQALCQPAKTVVADERNRARRKVQRPR